jgi:hypothetical protein
MRRRHADAADGLEELNAETGKLKKRDPVVGSPGGSAARVAESGGLVTACFLATSREGRQDPPARHGRERVEGDVAARERSRFSLGFSQGINELATRRPGKNASQRLHSATAGLSFGGG